MSKMTVHRYHICARGDNAYGDMCLDAKEKIITDEQFGEVRDFLKEKMKVEKAPVVVSFTYLGKQRGVEWREQPKDNKEEK